MPREESESSVFRAAESLAFLVKTDASYVPHRNFLISLVQGLSEMNLDSWNIRNIRAENS